MSPLQARTSLLHLGTAFNETWFRELVASQAGLSPEEAAGMSVVWDPPDATAVIPTSSLEAANELEQRLSDVCAQHLLEDVDVRGEPTFSNCTGGELTGTRIIEPERAAISAGGSGGEEGLFGQPVWLLALYGAAILLVLLLVALAVYCMRKGGSGSRFKEVGVHRLQEEASNKSKFGSNKSGVGPLPTHSAAAFSASAAAGQSMGNLFEDRSSRLKQGAIFDAFAFCARQWQKCFPK